jgi:FkbM family methyltransferase
VRRARRGLRRLFHFRSELARRDAEIQRLQRKLTRRAATDAAPDEAPLWLDYPGAEIKLVPASGKRHRSCEKEPFTVDWIERHLRNGETLYDIGANVGAYSLVAAKAVPGARVVAFEPAFPAFSVLCENIVLNGLHDRITPLPVALGDATALRTFRYSSLKPSDAGHNAPRASAYTQPVAAYRLDDLVRQFELPWPTHIKLDVDGFEVAVLEGATDTLAAPELRTLMVEIAVGDDAVVSLLESRGFELKRRFEKEQEGFVSYGLFTAPRV